MAKYNYKENSQFTRSGVPRNPSYPSDWPKRRQVVLNRDYNECRYCGNRQIELPLRVHHVKPISKGGKHNIGNLVTVCIKCHSLVHPHNKTLNDEYVHELQKRKDDMLNENLIDEGYLDNGIKPKQLVPEDYYYPEEYPF